MSEQDLDRNESATPYKLEKAKEKGQVAKSSDVISSVVFMTAAVYLVSQGSDAIFEQFKLDQALLRSLGSARSSTSFLWPLISAAIGSLLIMGIPFFVLICLSAVLANVLQTGFVFSPSSLSIDLARINPIAGFKKILSIRTLFDTAKAVIKLSLLSVVAFYALSALSSQFYGIANLSPTEYVRLLISDAASLSIKIASLLIFIAFLDWIFTRREFSKKMRMSKREIKDEHKQRDGDPRVKSRIRELQREALKKSKALQQTKNADVVLTNPTHVAVALRYEHGKMESPQIVAKGAGHLAFAIRQIASKHNIPVVQSPSLARRIFKELDVEQEIPPKMFAEVARIVVWVFAMRDRNKKNEQRGGVE